MVDILLSVLNACIAIATAYYGVHVAMHPESIDEDHKRTRHKKTFFWLGLVSCVLIGVQGWRNNAAQEKLARTNEEIRNLLTKTSNTAEKIEKDVSRPININVPPPQVIQAGRSDQQRERRLTDLQQKSLTKVLSKLPSMRLDNLFFTSGSLESQKFCGDLSEVFIAAGWGLGGSDDNKWCTSYGGGSVVDGVQIEVFYHGDYPIHVSTIKDALASAGIKVSSKEMKFDTWKRSEPFALIVTVGVNQ